MHYLSTSVAFNPRVRGSVMPRAHLLSLPPCLAVQPPIRYRRGYVDLGLFIARADLILRAESIGGRSIRRFSEISPLPRRAVSAARR